MIPKETIEKVPFSVNLQTIILIASVLISGLSVYFGLKSRIDLVEYRLVLVETATKDIQSELKKHSEWLSFNPVNTGFLLSNYTNANPKNTMAE